MGRRIAKRSGNKEILYIWSGNVLLHEVLKTNDNKQVITWVYEQGSFVPTAKLTDNESFSIISDYIGRPVLAFDENGEKVWSADYDIYGKLTNLQGDKSFIPFRQLGQYEDVETGLYYNRFRYYDPNSGLYISQDPIGLAGGLAFYAYVHDVNGWVDIFGLTPWGDLGVTFADWWDNYASPTIVKANKSSVSKALRAMNGGGNHEMFPVSMAEKAKELDFKYSDLEVLSIKTSQIEFEIDGIKGSHPSSGVPNNRASSLFHSKLIRLLDKAKTKGEALAIIKKHIEII
ncbi:conserved hypothetical protein [Capnocytophaga canimorsus]|nr:conserved hypothetical protein [Capnocytophaga canimorsus]